MAAVWTVAAALAAMAINRWIESRRCVAPINHLSTATEDPGPRPEPAPELVRWPELGELRPAPFTS